MLRLSQIIENCKPFSFLYLVSICLVTSFLPNISDGCCWLKDPKFITDPTVYEFNPNLIRVNWKDSVERLNCVDHFYVNFWEEEKRNESQTIYANSSPPSSKMFVDIKVKDNTNYTIMVNAYEDGLIDCGDNWSNQIHHKTSKIRSLGIYISNCKIVIKIE